MLPVQKWQVSCNMNLLRRMSHSKLELMVDSLLL